MSKYLEKMQWQPEVIYYVRGFSRNEKYPPKVWDNINKKTGNTFHPTDVKVARYNTKDKTYTEIGEYQFIVAYSILEEVKNYVSKNMAFYLVKGIDDEYKVYSNPNEITDIQQEIYEEKEVKPIQQDGDIAFILEFVSNIDNTLNMILNAILEKEKK